MKRQPTTIGPSTRGPAIPPQTEIAVINTGSIVLQPEQQAAALEALGALEFSTIPSRDIIGIGLLAEQALQQTLDGFLARLDKKSAAEVFALFRRLEKGVNDADLPDILERIEQGDRPGVLGSILGRFRGKNADDLVRETLDEIAELITGRTATLADEMNRLQTDLQREMETLFTELQSLDTLRRSYSDHFAEFTVSAAVAQAFLERARAYTASEEASANPSDVAAQTRVRELQDKLRLLESRALALEGTYTRLPADQLVIQQIEQAGIATLQETATTVASRFASIKMTLLAIHGAFSVKSVQQISSRQAKLDQQLTDIRARVTKDAAVTAAKAPGENRLAQAQQIQAIVASMAEIHDLVQVAQAETEQNFEQARSIFASARNELLNVASK